MTVSRDPAKIEELLSRGVAEIVDRTSLGSRLRAGKPLRIKLGIDPTSPHLHLGRSIALWKLRDFQELGHQVVLILGDFTGTIGDASDKDAERPVLDQATVDANLETYAAQAGKILDMSRVEVRRNSEWLDKVSYRELCRQADVFSVNDFVSREMVAKRLKEGKRVSLREVLYPLMQGYDSVAVRADVELGGTDQRFNMLAGRDLQRLYGQAPQDIVINALVPGTDGRKMSSSWGNTVNLDEKPREMFQKVMRLADGLVSTYFSVATRVPLAEVAAVLARLEAGENPRDVKMDLAAEIVRVCHGGRLGGPPLLRGTFFGGRGAGGCAGGESCRPLARRGARRRRNRRLEVRCAPRHRAEGCESGRRGLRGPGSGSPSGRNGRARPRPGGSGHLGVKIFSGAARAAPARRFRCGSVGDPALPSAPRPCRSGGGGQFSPARRFAAR